MHLIAIRGAAFVVGSLIAGWVYATDEAAHPGTASSPPVLALHPGATATSGDPNGDRSDVTLHVPGAALHLVAARYRSDDAPAKVAAFYRVVLATFGHRERSNGGPHWKAKSFGSGVRPDVDRHRDADASERQTGRST